MKISSPTPTLRLSDAPDAFTLTQNGDEFAVFLGESEMPAVQRAVQNLVKDICSVSAAEPRLTAEPDGARIVVGTVGVSPAITSAVHNGLLDVSALSDEKGDARWEAFQITVSAETLYLVGADRRGTIYAVYALAEAIGVSPWCWWGDVQPERRSRIAFAWDTRVVDWPSVRYRGVFINDEEELDHWARRHTSDATLGPATYERLYELILRLKGNYLWPAMHVNAFNDDPENGRLAQDMGMVIGSSHCDMLLRSNEHEFRPWAAKQSDPVEYDYSLPDRNRKKLLEYWRGSVEQNRDHEVTWTVGMRGIHDYGFQTTAIDADETLSDADKFDAKVRLLEQAMSDQRDLLELVLGVPASTVPQIFIPYKEVLPLYDAGLAVPDDITIVWPNDNFGHVRRFPADAELERSGGHGLYYHSSYWSDFEKSYLATSSTPLALMKSELRKSWDRGIRQLWVNNVGGLKPLELEMEFFLRSAWEAGKETTTSNVDSFVASWIDTKFSGLHGQDAATILRTYYQLNNQRKYEHLHSGSFPQIGYGDEAGRRVAALRELYLRSNTILMSLPESERDSFFQLFAVKIHMAFLTNAQFLHADRSTLAHSQKKLRAADQHVELSRFFDRHKRATIHFYNHEMSDGKWAGMFTPEDFPPPVMPLHPPATPALRIAPGAGLGVVVWGELSRLAPSTRSTLTFSQHSRFEKWIEIFATGASPVSYLIQADPWITVSKSAGTTDAETRVYISPKTFPREGLLGTVRIFGPETGEYVSVEVVVEPTTVPVVFDGLIEADGYVSIDPSAPDAWATSETPGWAVVPGLGRYGTAALQAHRSSIDNSSPAEDRTRAAWVEYAFYLESPGAHRLQIHRNPTLDATGRIRIEISVDDGQPILIESPTTDEHRGTWNDAVQDNIEILAATLPELARGPHALRLHPIDDGFTLSKIVVLTSPGKVTNLGPDFSQRAGRQEPSVRDPQPLSVDPAILEDAARHIYRAETSDVPLPPQVYAGKEFWQGDTTFRRNRILPQQHLGSARHHPRADGDKDIIASLQGGAVIEHGGVIAFEAENALANNLHGWHSPATDETRAAWTHTAAETDGRTGLAMHVAERHLEWFDARVAPALHYTVEVSTSAIFHAWLLVKYDDGTDDALDLAVDDVVLPTDQQFSGGSMCTYGSRQVWLWALVADLQLTQGQRKVSVIARKSGLRIDRLYFTTGAELPPTDDQWRLSARREADTAGPIEDDATRAPQV